MKLLIRQHMGHVKFMESQIKEINGKIIHLFSTLECCITTIPGVGPILGATIFAGIDPTIKQSGEYSSTHNHMSKRGSPYLRRAIWQASTLAAMHEPNLKEFSLHKTS